MKINYKEYSLVYNILLFFAIVFSGIFAVIKYYDKPVKYRIEQLYYKNGHNFAGTMWNDSKKINDNTYSYHIPEHFNPNYENCESGFDSVVFKIVEVK